MKPVYKKVPVVKKHCPICGKKLLGNNSIGSPWQCDCGFWEAVPKFPWNGEYQIRLAPKEFND